MAALGVALLTGLWSCESENPIPSADNSDTTTLAKGSNIEKQIIEIINQNCGTIDYDQAGTPEAEYQFSSLKEFEQTISGICGSSVLPISL